MDRHETGPFPPLVSVDWLKPRLGVERLQVIDRKLWEFGAFAHRKYRMHQLDVRPAFSVEQVRPGAKRAHPGWSISRPKGLEQIHPGSSLNTARDSVW